MLSDNLSPRVVQLIHELADELVLSRPADVPPIQGIDEPADQDAHCRRLMSVRRRADHLERDGRRW